MWWVFTSRWVGGCLDGWVGGAGVWVCDQWMDRSGGEWLMSR